MTEHASDARWPKLLSLAVHEFRTPMTVVAGYIRMLLKERAGPLSEQQRKLLEEAEKSCGRLSGLIGEMSELSNLEAGTAAFNTAAVDLQPIIEEAIAALPALPERDVGVVLEGMAEGRVRADPIRLKGALTSIITAVRRELVTSDRLLVQVLRDGSVAGPMRIVVGDVEQIEGMAEADAATLDRFDEWRGGSGLSLAIARRIIQQHGGALLSPPGNGKVGAIITLPRE